MGLIKYIVHVCTLMVIGLVAAGVYAAPKSEMIEFWNDYEPDSALKMNHSAWDEILKKYVVTDHPSGVNRFRYDDVTAEDKAAVEAYLTYLQSRDPRQLNHHRKKAYWMNFYNAAIVSIVLTEQPEDTIRDVGRIWTKKRFVVTRQEMSLNDIEHGVIRPFYNDPRVHFGFTPATIGSGNILPMAFTGQNVEELLDLNTRAFFANSERGMLIQGRTLRISSIFKWYKDDFGGTNGSVRTFIKKHVPQEVADAIDQTTRVSYQYSWSLNKP